MPKVKIQHYVPRFYLKQFCYDDDHICVFDKVKQEIFSTNTENIAGEKGFYDIVPQESFKEFNPQTVELFLSMIETNSPILLDNVVTSIQGNGVISPELKKEMAFYLAIQHLRTACFRKEIIELQGKTWNTLLKKTGEAEEYFVEFDEEKAPLENAMMMVSPQMLNNLIGAFQKHFWILGVNTTSTPLWTSDNPLVKRAHKNDPYVSYEGFLSEGIEIAFPLTPKYVLLLVEREYHSHMATFDERTLALADEQMIIYYNCLQVLNSSRQVYSPSREFDLVVDMCQKNPSLRDPDRDRIQVG